MTPIILHHGVLYGDYKLAVRRNPFKDIDTAIAAAGHPVFISSVHPTAGIKRRAQQLKKWLLSIRSEFKSQRAILIAHSMGGLDARYMLAKLGVADQVQTLVTISTPHRGSPYADWCAENLGRKLRGFELMRFLGWDIQALNDLTTEQCARFNEEIHDVPDVTYYSISTARPLTQIPAIALHPWAIVRKAEGANDGLVSIKSAKWGKHMGTWRIDHWHGINRRISLAAHRDGDISPRYLALLKTLRPT